MTTPTKWADVFPMDVRPENLVAALESVTDVRQVRNEFGDLETHIMYDGRWHHLTRTDLKDDVCTWDPYGEGKAGARGTLDLVLARAKKDAYYGARIGWRDRQEEVPRFAVIDSWSDG